jgi:diaminohydroxyphosphoribosylaminopyrimidine deaminase / 5-amino-6-(5-phosphoribosylamino)uracil reductase
VATEAAAALSGQADAALMAAALAAAADPRAHRAASPNPCVGAAIRTLDGRVFSGHTEPIGGAHAEVVAIRAATATGANLSGATIATTLEPCDHHGRTGPCTQALIGAHISRVIVALTDPDPKVAGKGLTTLRAAGLEVVQGVESEAANDQLAAYLHHRRTGRPFVTLKLAMSLDGRTAAPDRTSQWITGPEARTDVHRLRAEHDAILVGAGTVRADNPSLTVRHVDGPDPRRVVLGVAPLGAAVHPCTELSGDLATVLDTLGAQDVLTLMLEGGPTVAHAFHQAGFVNRYVVYLAPVLFGGDDALGLFRGPGAGTIGDAWRGELVSVTPLGHDLRLEYRTSTDL